MPCVLTTGFPLDDCIDGVGGVIEARFAKLSDIASMTITAGAVTAIAMVATKKFQKYSFKRETATFTETENTSFENGSLFYDQKAEFQLNKLSAVKRNELNILAMISSVCIVTLNDGNNVILGAEFGLTKSGSAESGKMFGDMNGFKLTLTGKEKQPHLYIATALLAAITV